MPDFQAEHEYDILLPTLKANVELGTALTEALLKIKDLERFMRKAHDILYNAPELNMSNYSEDEVDSLNNAVIEAIQVLSKHAETTNGT